MPVNLRRLVVAVGAGGAGALVASIISIDATPALWRLLLVAAVFVGGETAMFHIRLGHDHRSFTWAETAAVVSLAAVPAAWGVVVASAAVASVHVVRRRPAVKVMFNGASVAIGLYAAGFARRSFSGTFVDMDLRQARSWLSLAVAGAVYFVVTTALVSAAVAWSQGTSVWRLHLRDLPLNALVAAGNIALGVLVVSEAALQPTLLLPLPLLGALLVFLYRSYLRAWRDRDVWQALQAASGDLLRIRDGDLTQTILDWSSRLFDAETVELVSIDAERAVVGSKTEDGTVHRRTAVPVEMLDPILRRSMGSTEIVEVHASQPSHDEASELTARGLSSCMVAPLLVHDECVGVLRLGFRGKLRTDARERQIFSTFANHVSSALSTVRLFEESRHRALHDPLTGLPNRMLLMDRLQHALDLARRRELSVAVLFLDLDRFKVVNDSLGHELGDRLLVAAARRIASVLRPGDTATRFGGDEFVVVCDDVASADDALDIANRLAHALVAPFDLAGHEVYVTASVGVALSMPDTTDAGSLIRDADAAMYRAKDGGRARAELFDARMRTDAVERLETENDLRRAIDRGELRLYYQPAFDLETGSMQGVEALVRWDHPDKGLVPPSLFVPLAEETGLISRVTEWVAEQACTDLASWRATGCVGDDFRVAINLSATELVDADVVDTIVSAVGRHRLSPAQIAVEITETALLGDLDRALSVLERLRRFGVTVALDDFGTGYSSLSYLRRLPVNALKVDRSFIASLGEDTRDGAVVAAVVDLAHALGLHVVAEGVEDARQVLALRGLGCDSAQGWYFSQALPAAELFPATSSTEGEQQADEGPLAPIISIA